MALSIFHLIQTNYFTQLNYRFIYVKLAVVVAFDTLKPLKSFLKYRGTMT
jgi:hypothetical protein